MIIAPPNKDIIPRYYIWTIGCQMNKAESERLGRLLEERGYKATTDPEKANVIVVNSCVVREHAEIRVINKLHTLKPLKLRHPGVTIALTGCLVDSNAVELKKGFPHIDHLFKPGELPSWLDDGNTIPSMTGPAPATRHTVSAYIPIIQGCDQFCTYCIVPYRRGREKSRTPAEITDEAEGLASCGVREITLLGQNVDAYGHDLPERTDLADMLETLNAIDGIDRIRFLTNHPKDMSTRLINNIARLDKVCEQINLPVQSGSNEILKAMKRDYTTEQYRELVGEIRRNIPGVALSTDIIVGFPSESREHFEQTVNLLADLQFDAVHIAAYSPRPGTAAARNFEDDVPPSEKKRRLATIEKLQTDIASGINACLSGQTMEVLVEGKDKDNWHGRTRSNKPVFFRNFTGMAGELVNVRIERTGPWSLQGYVEPGGMDR